MKRFFIGWILLALLAALALAADVPKFTLEVTTVSGDAWTGLRYQLAPTTPYPWSGAVWWVIYAGRTLLNPDDPGGALPPQFVPVNVSNRYFIIPKPDLDPGPWHNVVHVLDADGALVARTDDFIVDVEAGGYVYDLPALSVGYGLQSAVQVVNPGIAPALVDIYLYDLDAGGLIVGNTYEVLGGAGVAFFLADWTPLFKGYVTVYSDRPLLVTGMTGQDILNGNYLVMGQPR